MTLRKIFFWLHLATGVVAGLVVLIMSVTGVLLMYEKQITAWADRDFRVAVPSSGTARLPVEALLAKVRENRSALPSTLTLRSDPAEPAALGFGRTGTLYMNPYSGEILGEGSKTVRSFFHEVTDWHRWLGVHGESRSLARAVTGASNLAFLFLVSSGFYIWWPKQWTWRQVRNVTWFRRGLPGKARDFNWHNVIGFWSAIPLFIVVLSATVISYPWASNLVYRMVGEEPPAPANFAGPRPTLERQRGEARPAGGAGVLESREPSQMGRSEHPEGERPRRVEGLPRATEGQGSEGRPAEVGREARVRREGPRGPSETGRGGQTVGPPADLNLEGFDALWARAEQQQLAWKSISLRLPNSAAAPLSFTIDQGNGGQPQKRSQLTLNRTTGEIVRWEPFSSMSLGRRLRSILRFAHTGEVAGIAGQTLAGMVSAGASVLVYTGFALSWRRFRAWQLRRRSSQSIESESTVVAGVLER